jgi:superfamily II DNA or RNA helicase
MQLSERLSRAALIESRRRAIAGALAAGALGLDVLSVPLFPYQREGVAHLLRAGRAILADDMGLGKTAQAIAACELLRARGEASRVIVVTLSSLKHQWAREIERFAGVRAVVVGGGAIGRSHALRSDAPYKILNYELTWRELSELQGLDADVVIYDEAQRAKNFRTKTARTIQQIPSRFAFVLTGTPIENRLDDLYSLMQVVDPKVFGPLWKFNLAFHQQTDTAKITGYKNLSNLRERIAPVVLRRRKEEILTQLPSLTEQTRYTPLTTAQQELEQGYRRNAAQLMAKAQRGGLTKKEQDFLMMNLLKARQACNAAELCDPKRRGSPKLDELEAVIDEIVSQGASKVLVFSEWVEMLKLAAQRLDSAGIGHVMLHGGVPTDRRPALLDRFRDSDDVRVLLSTEAGGTGLNLQVASYVVHLDLPWNPGKLDQRNARAHRMGQTRRLRDLPVRGGGNRARNRRDLGGKARGALRRSRRRELRRNVGSAELYRVLGPAAGDHGRAGPEAGVEVDAVVDAEAVDAEIEAASRDEEVANTHPSGATAPSDAEGSGLAAAPAMAAPRTVRKAPPVSSTTAVLRVGDRVAQRRLALARVVVDAGFPADAVRAAYEAIAAAIGSCSLLLPATPRSSRVSTVSCSQAGVCQRGRTRPWRGSTISRSSRRTASRWTQGWRGRR